MPAIIICGTAEARVAKFCTQVEYIKCWPWDDQLPANGRGQGHVIRFFNFGPYDIFRIGEARHFKFCVLTDTEKYYCVHDRLPPLPKGTCSG